MFELLNLAHEISLFAICGEGNVSARQGNNFLIKSFFSSAFNAMLFSHVWSKPKASPPSIWYYIKQIPKNKE